MVTQPKSILVGTAPFIPCDTLEINVEEPVLILNRIAR
jgi:hypothetical protein